MAGLFLLFFVWKSTDDNWPRRLVLETNCDRLFEDLESASHEYKCAVSVSCRVN